MLRLISCSPEPIGDVSWRFESPVPGVVLIDVNVGSGGCAVPLHWRAGDWSKPPLDVSLSPQGRIEALRFVLQDEQISRAPMRKQRCIARSGAVTFDVDGWASDRYLDERVKVSAARSGTDELILRFGDSLVDLEYFNAGHGLLLGFDRDELTEVVLGPLSRDDWNSVGTSVLGD